MLACADGSGAASTVTAPGSRLTSRATSYRIRSYLPAGNSGTLTSAVVGVESEKVTPWC